MSESLREAQQGDYDFPCRRCGAAIGEPCRSTKPHTTSPVLADAGHRCVLNNYVHTERVIGIRPDGFTPQKG